MKTFTPWLWGAVLVQGTHVAVYLVIGRQYDPVGWGFVMVASVLIGMLASVGTEIVHAIRSLKR